MGIDLQHCALRCPASRTWRARGSGVRTAAGATFARGVEAVEARPENRSRCSSTGELFVDLVVALLAEPQQAIQLIRQTPAFDHQADRIGHALRRMRHARRQQKISPARIGMSRMRAVLLDAQHQLEGEMVLRIQEDGVVRDIPIPPARSSTCRRASALAAAHGRLDRPGDRTQAAAGRADGLLWFCEQLQPQALRGVLPRCRTSRRTSRRCSSTSTVARAPHLRPAGS